MRGFGIVTIAAALVSAPAQAADPNGGERLGAFAGARLTLSLGGNAQHRVQTGLSVAPLRLRQEAGTGRSTVFGRGLELGFSGRKPELRLAGMRADRALLLAQGRPVDASQTNGLSTGAWAGIAAGVIVIGAVVFVATMTCVGRDRDYCGSD